MKAFMDGIKIGAGVTIGAGVGILALAILAYAILIISQDGWVALCGPFRSVCR